MEQPNRRRLLAGPKGYTVGTVILLYTCLMVWLYVSVPALLGVLAIIAVAVMIAGTVERWRPRQIEARKHDSSGG